MLSSCCNCLSQRPFVSIPSNSRVTSRVSNPIRTKAFNRSLRFVELQSKSSIKKWKISCFRHEEESCSGEGEMEFVKGKVVEEVVELKSDRKIVEKKDFITSLRDTAVAVFKASEKPWTVPWSAETIIQVMLLWIAAFWFVGSWIIPFLAHASGFSKESLAYRAQALYSLLTDVAEGLAGIAILHRCLARFRPLPSDWFKFSLKGNWQFDVGLGCLMFPLVNRLSQVNLNLVPHLSSAPVVVSSVEQSIVARDSSGYGPICHRDCISRFLLPSLTKYMPVWCAILVSSVAFALAHFNAQRMLPLIFLWDGHGNSFLHGLEIFWHQCYLHSLWNGFVFLDLMK
ncbi:hypothetical protein MKW92_010245 [Papaver armeniacum]|nr:hypothetical protein MKW92_010245 [Papaver armeniacum]